MNTTYRSVGVVFAAVFIAVGWNAMDGSMLTMWSRHSGAYATVEGPVAVWLGAFMVMSGFASLAHCTSGTRWFRFTTGLALFVASAAVLSAFLRT